MKLCNKIFKTITFAKINYKDGGAERIRTAYPLVANEVLYQMSYDPNQLIYYAAIIPFIKLNLD